MKNTEGTEVPCPYACGKNFLSANALERHMRKCRRKSKRRFAKFVKRPKDME